MLPQRPISETLKSFSFEQLVLNVDDVCVLAVVAL